MKTIKDFYAFANLKGRVASLAIMLILTSFLYCSIYSMGISVAYRAGSTVLYYVFLYLIVIIAAYVYMIIMFQFIRNKRGDSRTLVMKEYMLPLLGTQTLFFVLMAGSSIISFQLILSAQQQLNAIVMTPIMLLLTLFYIPMQVFACFQIYDGQRNPFLILKNALVKILKHYQSCFYSLLPLLLVNVLYQSIMSTLFNYTTAFAPNSAVVDIMTSSNPFLNGFDLGISAFQNTALLPATICSFAYGIVMCIMMVFYYTFMVCVFDEDVRV